MILWALLYLSFGSSFALPTPSDIPIDFSPSPLACDADKFGTRSIWSIIWSCFSTLFACSWIAVHPNIPAPKDTQWAVLGRRLAIMGYVLIAPEMVILWAAQQHYGAKYVLKQQQNRGWTMTHAFFIIMGGFTLHDEQGTPLRILEPNELESLSKAGRIKWPAITEAEIQDRSKGDHLSKGIVLIQTSWFITQCIVRGAYRLQVTELEVTTLAFAVLTGVIYYLWWNKPLDVRCSVPVYLLQDDEKEKVDSQNTSPVSPVEDPVSIPPIIPCDLNSNRVDSQSSHSTRMQQFFSFIQRQRQEYGSVLGLAYVFVLHPLFSFFDGFKNMVLHPLFSFFGGFGDMVGCNLDRSMPLRVPTFYSPFTDNLNAYGWEPFVIAVCVGVVFGAIHCVAWSFHFPTTQEKVAWRISAASVAGLPVFPFHLFILANYSSTNILVNIFEFMIVALFTLYVIARIVLLVLPCIALRALNPAALVEIQWAASFPHIG